MFNSLDQRQLTLLTSSLSFVGIMLLAATVFGQQKTPKYFSELKKACILARRSAAEVAGIRHPIETANNSKKLASDIRLRQPTTLRSWHPASRYMQREKD